MCIRDSAYNTLKRNVAVDILSGADIEADFGEVLIRADAGSRATIYTDVYKRQTLSSSPSALRAVARRRSAWAPACWCSRTT